MDDAALILPQIQRLESDFQLTPVTAAEIEFYLHGSEDAASLEAFWAAVNAACADAGLALFNTSREKGHLQHEAAIRSAPDALKTVRDTRALISIITDAAQRYAMRADFAAKPFADQPGSGLHMHVHLANARGKNVFYKDDDTISDQLLHSIGGLISWMCDSMAVFAPREESYARFIAKNDAPVTVSWGANNRTVALRLPIAPHEHKHIEHRVAGSDADPARVMAVILAAMHDGLAQKRDPGAQIYGDASLEMYGLARLPSSLGEARERLRESGLIAGYFNPADLG